MRKLQILTLSLLFIFNACVSTKKSELKDKRVFGNVVKKVEIQYGNDFVPDSTKIVLEKVKSFSVFLTKKKKINSNLKLFYHSDNSSFDFMIPTKKIKKYKYLLFESQWYYRFVEINSIKGELKDLILDKTYAVIKVLKPAIYLYPNVEQKITIKHDFKGQIKNTYPKYTNKWEVIAKPNGQLKNLADKRSYNYLFWDGVYNFPKEHYNYKTGFIVKKSNLIKFLQEHLTKIGLNNTEINDFIVYWLPLLNKNDYNFIHFRINDNIDNISFLNVDPKPDTVLRVFMEFKGVEKDLRITKQELKTIKRNGFTLVEWGGAYIGFEKIE